MIRWTAPDANGDGSAYMVQINGYAYLWGASWFPTWWQLKQNDVTFSDGLTPTIGPIAADTSNQLYGPDNKVLFANGSGGASAMILTVSVGDNIDLIVPDSRGEYFGGQTAIMLEIEQIPEPATMLLLGLGSLAILRRKR